MEPLDKGELIKLATSLKSLHVNLQTNQLHIGYLEVNSDIIPLTKEMNAIKKLNRSIKKKRAKINKMIKSIEVE